MNTIQNTIVNILIDDLFISVPRDDINLNDNMRDVLGLDSLGFSKLRAQCEYAFGIKITDDQFTPKHFDSIATLSALIEQLKANSAQ